MARHRLLVAFVFNAAVAAEIDGLRRAFGGPVERIVPHVTLVPPRNVAEERLDEVLAHVADAAASSRPLDLVIGGPASFAPARPVLYLELAGDLAGLSSLAGRLASGALAPPAGRPERAFVGHVTLANRCAPERIAAARAALGALGLGVVVDRVTVLCEDPGAGHAWSRIADAPLGPAAVVGRGGRELSFSERAILSPGAQRLLEGHAPTDSPGEAEIVLECDAASVLVGVAAGTVAGRLARLGACVVTASRRGEGIGTALLAQFERVAGEHGAHVVRAVAESSAAARFLSRRGYAVRASLFGAGAAREDVVLERHL